MRAWVAAVLVALAIAACGEPFGPEDWTEPPAQPGPIELMGLFTEAIHAGDSGVWVVPADRAGDPPAFCIAYLDGQARAGDTCTVDPQQFDWNEEVWPWVVRGWWIGLNVWDSEVSTHAFDDRGRPLAYWTGRMHPDAGI